MMHLLPLIPVLACAALMFGTGAIVWLAVRTPLRHTGWIARRASGSQTSPQNPDEA
jgi:hypothetical protein